MKTIIVIVVFVVIVGLFVGLYIRRREIAFEGVVTDKDVHETPVNNMNNMNTMNRPPGGGISIGGMNNGGVQQEYVIKVQTDTGKTLTWQVSEGKYQIINIGDRVSKPSGTTEVSVTAQASTAAPTNPAAPTPQPPTTPQPPQSTPPIA